MMLFKQIMLLPFLILTPQNNASSVLKKSNFSDDVCGSINGKRIYLEFGEEGTLEANYKNNIFKAPPLRCTVEFVSCPSCILQISFQFVNLSRNCGNGQVFDSCGCDYVWIFEPTFEQSSGEQFCGRFIESNASRLEYRSQTRRVAVEFLYNQNYEHAFTLRYSTQRNKVFMRGKPLFGGNTFNSSHLLTTPFFPNSYPPDLSIEHVVSCESSEICRITLVFSDFLIGYSSIIEFFDWSGERLFVTTGSIFRPPVIVTSGPSLTIRFYANGASSQGFKAHYTFITGNVQISKPDIDCGGHVNNLGGGITMMGMVPQGSKSFDCVWLIQPPAAYLHRKTHLYVKVAKFAEFAGSTDLTIRQGLTSEGPIVESLKSLAHFFSSKEKEHVVDITRGFYISLKGLFRPESRLALIYAAFNYKDCLAGPNFLCDNLRCISVLLNCDGFDHCGDNSDEYAINCSKDPHDRRKWSNVPNFLFPKDGTFANLPSSTVMFLLATLGLVGVIVVMVVLLNRVSVNKTRHRRQIQDHIDTIHAILEEGVGDGVEEGIIIDEDEPPGYEEPPSYDDAPKMLKKTRIRCTPKEFGGTSNCLFPDSPPPRYSQSEIRRLSTSTTESRRIHRCSSDSDLGWAVQEADSTVRRSFSTGDLYN